MAPRNWMTAAILAVTGTAAACAAAPPAPPPQRPTLTFEGKIDGSDRIIVTEAGARWVNLHWGAPAGVVRLNGFTWEPRVQPFLANEGQEPFLPPGVDLSRARLVSRSGRDYCGIEPGVDGLVLRFVDSPNGAAPYRMVVAFE